MDDSSITMEDYILNLTGDACWNDQIFDNRKLTINGKGRLNNWKLAVKGKTGRKLNAGNIESLQFVETKFPTIIYDDSLCYKESPLQNSSQIFDDKSELFLPNTDYCTYMSEKKIFKKRFAKNEKFEILKIDTNLFSYELPKFEKTKIHNESRNFGKDYSDIGLCNTSSLDYNLNFDKLKNLFVSNHGINYYSLNNEIMIYIQTVVPFILMLNLYIPFDPKLVYKEKVLRMPRYIPYLNFVHWHNNTAHLNILSVVSLTYENLLTVNEFR